MNNFIILILDKNKVRSIEMKYKELRKLITKISPKMAHVIMFRKTMGKFPNLSHPKSFNEKISWIKLYELPKDPFASLVADKLAVRDYVADCGYLDILVPLIGSWKNSSDINFDTFPERFVLKCNHGCGMNLICTEKAQFDISLAKKRLDDWMRTDWALLSAEPHYGKIPRRIICEEYIPGKLVDYKFFCFRGIPRFYYISEGLEKGPTNGRISFFNMDGSPASFRRTDHEELENKSRKKPVYFDSMVKIAGSLSEHFKFARIDFLTNENEFFFSEITLTPCAGMMPLSPKEWDYKLGEMLVI